MTYSDYPSLLAALSAGGQLTAEWTPDFTAMPRHQFVPRLAWRRAARRYVPVDRSTDPQDWWELVHSDREIAIQLDNGSPGRGEATSTCPAPSVVAAMLRNLDARPGDNVLEVGTGSGWGTALLAHHLGEKAVTSTEVHQDLVNRAVDALALAGLAPEVKWHDGERGWARNGPYDRLIATCAVRTVPEAWLRQVRPGGTILAALHNPFGRDAVVRLTVEDRHIASGRFVGCARLPLFSRQRPLNASLLAHGAPRRGTSSVGAEQVETPGFALYTHALLPELHSRVARGHDGPRVAVYDKEGSYAQVGNGRVVQYGPRDLWREVEALWAEFAECGRPGLGCFGLTVTPQHHPRQEIWLRGPSRGVVAGVIS